MNYISEDKMEFHIKILIIIELQQNKNTKKKTFSRRKMSHLVP